ncbi:MAG: hypothetical protein ACOCUY_01720, partial [Verrucomicrobiota bacterium]
ILLRYLGPLSEDEGTPHGRIVMGRREIGPVGVTRAYGKGQFVYLSVPLGFTSMWRGTRFDPVARKIVRDAVAERYSPLFESLSTIGRLSRGRIFADDFMRTRGAPENWQVLNGDFLLAGGPKEVAQANQAETPTAHIPFTLHGNGSGIAQTGIEQAGDARLGASVLTEDGEGGIGIKTTNGRELSLLYNDANAKLQLVQGTGDSIRILDEIAVHRRPGQWLRISMMNEENHWTGWLDGQQLLRADAKPNETLGSHIRLVQTGGSVHYDDVILVERSSLLPGSDRAWGEEGSSWSHPGQTQGVEPRTIHSPLWYLRPDSHQRNAVRSALPCHDEDAMISMDGATLGRIPPDPARPLILLPENEQPRQSLRLTSALWRDYSFQGQLIDWYSTGSEEWQRIPRWACDRQWEWLGVPWTDEPATLWYRHRLTPPYSISFLCAPTSNDDASRRHHGEKGADLNLIIGGNGHNLNDGIVLRTGRREQTGIRLQRGGETIAQNRSVGLPQSLGTTLHHRWLWIQADVTKDRIVIRYEGRKALDIPLETPPPSGFAGFWTIRNSVQIARATLSLSPSRKNDTSADPPSQLKLQPPTNMDDIEPRDLSP